MKVKAEKTGSFLGTGWGFPPTFRRENGCVDMISDVDDINSSLEILLSTTLGERMMHPSYGCDLRRLLFEPLDTSLKSYIKEMITRAILYFEARILLEGVTLESKHLEGMLEITLEYRVRITNSRYNFVYPFYLDEGSNIQP